MLFEASDADAAVDVPARVAELEAKLRAIEQHPAIDTAAVRAAVSHTRLICSPSGYAFAEVDAPPPPPGSALEHDGEAYTVWKIGPSPLPADPRRCAVLVPA
jgi:hypothetical protein